MDILVILIAMNILIIIALKYLKGPHIYEVKMGENIKKYLYVLLYRGSYKGILLIENNDYTRSVFFSKYKIKSEIGINLHIPIYRDLNETENEVIKILDKNDLEFYIDETKDPEISKVFIIDLKKDLNSGNNLYKLFLKVIYRISEGEFINIYFNEVNHDPSVIIGFSEIPDFKKMGIDITIPVTNGGYLCMKFGHFLGIIFSVFSRRL